jgi:hypothetical protein
MPSFPGFERLYVLDDPFAKRYLRGRMEYDGDALSLTLGEAQTDEAIAVKWAMGGREPADVVWTTLLSPLLIHCRIRDLLLEERVTGWTTYPVLLSGKNGKPYPDYVGLSVLGRCGTQDLTRSSVVVKQYPGGWFPHLKGQYFDESSWDGHDLFMERRNARGSGNAAIFASEKVVQAAWRAKVTNVSFTRLTDVSVAANVYDTESGRARLPADFVKRVHAAYEDAGVPRPRQWAE